MKPFIIALLFCCLGSSVQAQFKTNLDGGIAASFQDSVFSYEESMIQVHPNWANLREVSEYSMYLLCFSSGVFGGMASRQFIDDGRPEKDRTAKLLRDLGTWTAAGAGTAFGVNISLDALLTGKVRWGQAIKKTVIGGILYYGGTKAGWEMVKKRTP